MPRRSLDERLHALVTSFADRPDTGVVRFAAQRPSTGWRWSSGQEDAPFFIASITKLYTTALIIQLVDRGAIALDAPLTAYLPHELVARLHILRGVDRSGTLTIRHLLAQTSGLPDHFEDRRTDGTTTFGRAKLHDAGWTLEEVVAVSRDQQRPRFRPGAPRRAHYSDTNFQLLGGVIEAVTERTYAQAVAERVCEPLGLTSTYVFGLDTLDRYDEIDPILDGATPLRVPLMMAACQSQGGIVSTTSDSLRFLRGFMAGELFDAARLSAMQSDWRRIFWPMRYGTGLMRFALPRISSPLAPIPPMVGHGGASGTALFRVPDLDLELAATVNQSATRSLPYRLLAAAVHEIRRG